MLNDISFRDAKTCPVSYVSATNCKVCHKQALKAPNSRISLRIIFFETHCSYSLLTVPPNITGQNYRVDQPRVETTRRHWRRCGKTLDCWGTFRTKIYNIPNGRKSHTFCGQKWMKTSQYLPNMA